MNVHESERLRVMLERAGFAAAGGAEDADVIIFQTCAIRNTAEQKIITHINEARKAMRRMRNETNEVNFGRIKEKKRVIAVIGCLSAYKEVKGVDIVLGTNELEKLVALLTTPRNHPPSLREVPLQGGELNSFGVGNSVIITHGCENFCAYCVVPYVRGKEFSRDIADVEAEFEQIKHPPPPAGAPPFARGEIGLQVSAAGGQPRVVWLLGQNVNSYKCPRTGAGFVALLDRLCAKDGGFQINFMSSHPKDFSTELVDCIARNGKIERNIHLPLQSGCDKILRAMNRRYTAAEYTAKIELLRKKVPGVRITTDIICGFPGETEADFAETVETVKRIGFNAAFIFPYSRRSGTAADKLPDQVDHATKKRRATELIAVQRGISKLFADFCH